MKIFFKSNMFSFNLFKYQLQKKRKEGLEKMWLSNNKQKHPLLLFANAIVKRSKKINCAMKTDHFGEVDTTAMLKLTNQKFMSFQYLLILNPPTSTMS